MKKVVFFTLLCVAFVGGYFVYQANQDKPDQRARGVTLMSICQTSNAHTGPQLTYRVAGDEISIDQFLIPSDYLIFNNGCHESPETVSREDIENGYHKIKENKSRRPNRVFNYPLYAVFPNFKPLEIEESFSHVKKSPVAHNDNLIVISISEKGRGIIQPPIDKQRILNEFNKPNPIRLENGIVKYKYDPETAKVYPNQFDKYFQEKDGQAIRFFRCRRDFENQELEACDYTFDSDDGAWRYDVSFNRARIQDIGKIEKGIRKLVESFVTKN